eukprot:GILJ01016985.1.p1 GENE.GILJ01016985.1~~GILJ01016985.1.p1  ORF type:complete len:1098 (-),score=124.86 GILJ01016985.1:216-3509(-)
MPSGSGLAAIFRRPSGLSERPLAFQRSQPQGLLSQDRPSYVRRIRSSSFDPTQLPGLAPFIPSRQTSVVDPTPLSPTRRDSDGIPTTRNQAAQGTMLLNRSPPRPSDLHASSDWSRDIVNPQFMSFADVFESLRTNPHGGLRTKDAHARLAVVGYNVMKLAREKHPFLLVLDHLFNYLMIMLLVAAILSLIVKAWTHAGILLFVIIVNVIIGFAQDHRTKTTLEALQPFSTHRATVRRDGKVLHVPSRELVPGDIVLLETGDIVHADLRLFECVDLEVDESVLTREERVIPKMVDVIEDEGDEPHLCVNMTFLGGIVKRGKGSGVVVATGSNTELGKITNKYAAEHRVETGLHIELNRLGYVCFGIGILLGFLVLATNGFDFSDDMLLYASAVAVAVVPESLLSVLTVSLVIGVRRLAAKKVVVKNIHALESLGLISHICCNKTHTLTQSHMKVELLWVPPRSSPSRFTSDSIYERQASRQWKEEEVVQVQGQGQGYQAASFLSATHLRVQPDSRSTLMLQAMTLCNSSKIWQSPDRGWHGSGDPVDVVTGILASELGFTKQSLRGIKMINEFPFHAEEKRMSTVHRTKGKETVTVFLKGAVEEVLSCCTLVRCEGENQPLTKAWSDRVFHAVNEIASKGYLLIAYAVREEFDFHDDMTRDIIHQSMTFLGLVAIHNPPHAESRDAVQVCYQAGIVVHVLTADHPATAAAVAKDIGIILEEENPHRVVWNADSFSQLSDKQKDELPELPRVLARCSIESKTDLIHALHRRDRVTAMIGAEVDDLPALRAADVGFSLNNKASAVTKSVADIILADDNFSTVVGAIQQGRTLFLNIQKYLVHLLSANVAQILMLTIGLAFRDGEHRSVFPMSPLQVLFVNLISISPQAVVLACDAGDASIMARAPKRTAKLFTHEVILDLIAYGCVIGALSLTSFTLSLYASGGLHHLHAQCHHPSEEKEAGCVALYRARGAGFATLVVLLLINGLNCVDPRQNLWRMFKRRRRISTMLWCCVFGFVILFPMLYVPVINDEVLEHGGFGWEWAMILLVAVLYMIYTCVYKACKSGVAVPWMNVDVVLDNVVIVARRSFTLSASQSRPSI